MQSTEKKKAVSLLHVLTQFVAPCDTNQVPHLNVYHRIAKYGLKPSISLAVWPLNYWRIELYITASFAIVPSNDRLQLSTHQNAARYLIGAAGA